MVIVLLYGETEAQSRNVAVPRSQGAVELGLTPGSPLLEALGLCRIPHLSSDSPHFPDPIHAGAGGAWTRPSHPLSGHAPKPECPQSSNELFALQLALGAQGCQGLHPAPSP